MAVIGGGISGLAAAHRMVELAPTTSLALFEASQRLGGVLRTEHRDGFLLEHSADNFITSVPWAVDLCRRIGFEDQLCPTRSSCRQALVVRRGRLLPVPDGFALMAPAKLGSVLTTRILSWRGKLRLAAEYFIPRRREESDESLASFVRRRLGREAFERLVQPLVGGIYTADAEQLSLAATLPRFIEMEREYGGLIRGARREASAARTNGGSVRGVRYSLFVAPRQGMENLVSCLAAKLPPACLRLGTKVVRLARSESGGWVLALADGRHETFDGVIVAAPAPAAGQLLGELDPTLAQLLSGIPYASAAVVLAGYERRQIGHPLDAFGFVVPRIEKRGILSASFSSIKYEGRAPDGQVLIRAFVGGALRPELTELAEDELRRTVCGELEELLAIRGEPRLFQIVRWRGVMPQYHVGHLERLKQLDARVQSWERLELAGNAYHGVGVPHCVHSGELAAERLLSTAG